MAAPIVTLNADGTVQKLAWTYRLGDQSGTVKPEALVHDLIVQIDGDGSAARRPARPTAESARAREPARTTRPTWDRA